MPMDERNAFLIIKEHIEQHLQKGEELDVQRLFGDRTRFRFDMYLPNGCKSLGLNGAVAIELKSRLVSDTLQRLSFAFDHSQISQLILILLDEQDVSYYNSIVGKKDKSGIIGRNIRIVTIKAFLSELESDTYADDLIKKGFNSGNNENNNDVLVTELKQKLKNNSYTLFFGAGVSCSAGLPGWDKLLKGVLRKIIKLTGSSVQVRDYPAITKYCYCSNSPLIVAQYLSSNLPGNNLSEIVRKEIYRKPPTGSALLDALVELVNKKKPESIVTYNYDDLFESWAESVGIHCRSIAADNRVEGDELPVYHVHGVLPQKGCAGREEPIVLDEKSYHTENKDAFLWSNIEQMHALRRSVCIFVGLSMTDPNLRRLLDISHRAYGDESVYHYAFLKKEELRKNEPIKNQENQVVIEKLLRGLGVTTIWYDDHNDLPLLIKKLI